MKAPYIISALRDGRFMVHNPRQQSCDWEVVNDLDEARKKLKEKQDSYYTFVSKVKNK